MLLAASLLASAGCAVPQPRGHGKYELRLEPATKTWYHLYLPVDYVRNNGQHPDLNVKRWPLVMTFHGMKPYDNALPQEREWEQQADIYGYIVCAPQLETSDSFMEYPLTKEHSYVLRDKRNVIAVMDHVFATTQADPKRVLSTSWSCGGYLAHYFPNRFPDRFTCIATRLSNFSDKLMSDETVPKYRDKVAVAVFLGDSDFPACKYESEEAVAWYKTRGFNVSGKTIDNMGHQRIPQTAAAFFAEQLKIEPLNKLDAARTVASVQMTDYQPPKAMLAKMSPTAMTLASARPGRGTPGAARPESLSAVPAGVSAIPPKRQADNYAATNSGRGYPAGQIPSYDPTPERKAPSAPDPKPPAEKKELPPSVPPSGAGATRVAQATAPRSANLLEPVKPVPDGAVKPASPPARESKPKEAAPAEKPAAAPKPPARPFSPQDAGASRYNVEQVRRELAVKNPPPAKQPQTVLAKNDSPATPTMTDVGTSVPAAPKKASSPHAPKPEPLAKYKQVPIKLSGPAISKAPYMVTYRVELPRTLTNGADFLWLDNGVWLNDESYATKLYETPGRHEITVLMITPNNEAYRGRAMVEVFAP
jgi:poly(3-hydroxybutyrate) depolymerase